MAGSARTPNQIIQRITTVLPLLPVLIAALWWNTISVTVVVAVASFLGLREFFVGLRASQIVPYSRFSYVFGLCIVGAAYVQATMAIDLLLPTVTIGILASMMSALFTADSHQPLPAWALSFVAVIYVPLLLSHLILLRSITTPLSDGWISHLITPGFAWVVMALASTWLADTFAYFSGRAFGKHLLAPHISPKKTWEGSAGGLIGASLTGVFCVALLGLPIALWQGALIGGLAGVIGPIGDLAESQLKRQLGLKDVGSILPGHGGMLDRIDSVLFVVPVVYYLVRIWLVM
jgi:phosphatidate cytidylyltransferase